jgi:hypothetical protein
MSNLKKTAPWVEFAYKMRALFEPDPDVTVQVSDDDLTVRLLVDGGAKADALSKLLGTERDFGGTTVKIEIVPSNSEETVFDLYRDAFSGNPYFRGCEVADGIIGSFGYAVFEPAVVQYYDDDISEFSGFRSTLPATLADELLQADGVFNCTARFDWV